MKLCSIIINPGWVRSIGMYVCLSVRSHNSKTTQLVVHVAWLGPPLVALRYVMYFRFCGWRHVFKSWDQLARINRDVMFRRSSPGGGTSWTSDYCSVCSSSSECGTREGGGEVWYLRL